MTLWLSNLAAYSAQLAVLVGAGVMVVGLLRITAPAATLRFWQGVLAASLAWPAYQLWAHTGSSDNAAASVWTDAFSTASVWGKTTSTAAVLRAGLAEIDDGMTMLMVATIAAGAMIRLGWLALGLLRLRSIRAASEPANQLASVAVPLQQALGVLADIRFSSAVTSPATIGARRPVVLLPQCVADLPLAVQRAVLCHELLHVRRRDWLFTLLDELWCAMLWFHPAARVVASRLGLARETLVDRATLSHTEDRPAYAAALLEFAGKRPRLAGAAAFIGRRYLGRRIALLTQEVSMSRHSLAIRLALASTVVVLVTVATTSHVPISAASQSQIEKVYKSGEDGVTLPRPVKGVKPVYTAAALQAGIQGTVWVQAVVLANGNVGEASISKSLDREHGLDEEALKAGRQWLFTPGMREGRPVSVEVTIEMTFTLK